MTNIEALLQLSQHCQRHKCENCELNEVSVSTTSKFCLLRKLPMTWPIMPLFRHLQQESEDEKQMNAKRDTVFIVNSANALEELFERHKDNPELTTELRRVFAEVEAAGHIFDAEEHREFPKKREV